MSLRDFWRLIANLPFQALETWRHFFIPFFCNYSLRGDLEGLLGFGFFGVIMVFNMIYVVLLFSWLWIVWLVPGKEVVRFLLPSVAQFADSIYLALSYACFHSYGIQGVSFVELCKSFVTLYVSVNSSKLQYFTITVVLLRGGLLEGHSPLSKRHLP